MVQYPWVILNKDVTGETVTKRSCGQELSQTVKNMINDGKYRRRLKPIDLFSGLILGILFGIVIKRSRFCMTGLIRDIIMEGHRYNFIPVLAIISIEGFLYFVFAKLGFLRFQTFFPPFSLLAVGLGSFLFGIGAVMANGCLTSTLVKCGDGRLVGWISLSGFVISAYIVSATFPGHVLSKHVRSIGVVQDTLIGRRSLAPILVFALTSIITIILMVKHYSNHKLTIALPARYTGIKHWMFEKIWPIEIAAPIIGVLLGIGFVASSAIGRHYGVAIAMPIMSWVFAVMHPNHVVGGCNTYDQRVGWGSMFVLGVIIGVIIITWVSGELYPVKPTRKTALMSFLGSMLMGIGSMWGMGCLLSNGLVGTAQLSIKSWYALCFLIMGIWAGTRIMLKRDIFHKRNRSIIQ